MSGRAYQCGPGIAKRTTGFAGAYAEFACNLVFVGPQATLFTARLGRGRANGPLTNWGRVKSGRSSDPLSGRELSAVQRAAGSGPVWTEMGRLHE